MSCDKRLVLIYTGPDRYRGYIVQADETSAAIDVYDTVKKLSRTIPMFEDELEVCKNISQSLCDEGAVEYDTMIYRNRGYWEKLDA